VSTETDIQLAPLDPALVLGHAEASAAFAGLATRLRAGGYDGSPSEDVLALLAQGEPVDAAAARQLLGDQGWRALLECGALYERDDLALLSTKIFPMRSLLTVLPAAGDGEDIVYLGPDSILLLEVVWRLGGIGRYAADLGTGNGFIAAALATRFDHVVAADLSYRCVATAQLARVLNPHIASRLSGLQLDVAAGLRPAMFDIVTANAPWVPETTGPDGGEPRLFAAGGATGFELPRRFLDEAIDLLAPGGQAFIACMDITFADGSRPVADHVEQIEGRGLEVEVVETRLDIKGGLAAWAAAKAPGAVGARHVVVVVRAPR
jgi:SAM-dependent methyltransferase